MLFLGTIDGIKRAFIEQHGFPENPEKPGCTMPGAIPDGVYAMNVEGKRMTVRVTDDRVDGIDEKLEPGEKVLEPRS